MILKSYAKVNLFLKVSSLRPDGYHNIQSIFERVGLTDKIILKKRTDKLIKVSCRHPHVPNDQTNLCYRAARLLQDECHTHKGVDIKIIKNIPVGAGLGGGSGNAAAVILGLNKLWKLKLSRKRLNAIASKVGSDVPFFIHESSFAKVEGRGETVSPFKKLRNKKLWHLLAVPRIHVSTPLIYKKWDYFASKKGKYSRLTGAAGSVKILLSELNKKRPYFEGALFNSLQEVTCRIYPEVKRIISKFSEFSPGASLMSGSGPAVFALFASRKDARLARRFIFNKFKSAQVFVVSTV